MIVLAGTTKSPSSSAIVSEDAPLDLLALESFRCWVADGIVTVLSAAIPAAAMLMRRWSGPRRDPTAMTVNLRPWLSVPAVGRGVSSRRRTTSMAFSSSMILGCLEVCC